MERSTPTISLCMIVKNEEEVLARCLDSVEGAVDEKIIVDTGSTDRTKEIALRYGANVHEHEWRDSFSEARNYALQFVSGDWVLQLDADEELEREDIGNLKRVVQSRLYNAVFLEILNYQPQGRVQLYFPRLFRRGKAYYEGIVHNQLRFEGKPLLSKIRIHHYGYNLSPEKMVAKYQRSTELLEKQLQEDPRNVFAWYNLIRLHRNRKMFDIVADKGSYVLRNLSFEECENIYPMIGFDTATAFMELGDLDAAERVCRRVLERSPEFLDILYTLGQVYFKKKNYHHALNYLRQFLIVHEKLQKIPQLHLLSLGTIDYDYLVCSIIGDCFTAIGDNEQAIDFYNRALILFSHRGDTISRRMTVQKEVLSTLGNISIRVGNFDKAVEFFEAYLQQDQSNATVLNNLAGSLVQLGEERKAITIYKKALQVDRNYSGAKKNLQVLLRRKKQRARTAH